MTTELLDAFARVRVAAEAHMDKCDKLELPWSEETVTEVAAPQGEPLVHFVPFNKVQEGKGVGADYLWWWLDKATGEAFGMLGQAKVLKWAGKKPTVDVNYKQGKQLGDLLKTAAQFEVAAMYAVYTGGQVSHAAHTMHNMHATDEELNGDGDGVDLAACVPCRRMTIGLISAYQVEIGAESLTDTAQTFLHEYIALEDLVDPDMNAGQVHDRNVPEMQPGELLDWLMEPQTGVREVAKRVFAAVSAQRSLALSLELADPMTVPGEPVFAEVPQDTGHFVGPYFAHFLRGLRKSAPPYVYQAMTGGEVAADVMQAVDGLVIVTV